MELKQAISDQPPSIDATVLLWALLKVCSAGKPCLILCSSLFSQVHCSGLHPTMGNRWHRLVFCRCRADICSPVSSRVVRPFSAGFNFPTMAMPVN